MTSLDSSPDLVNDMRDLKARISQIERAQLGLANAKISASANAAWVEATLQSGFGYVAGYPVSYYGDSFNRVFVRGRVVVPGTAVLGIYQTIFTLPAGYRPPYAVQFPGSRVSRILTTGEFQVTANAGETIFIDSFSWRTV